MPFHNFKIVCVFSKIEHLLPKARNQLWWKLSVQLKHHGRMENIRGKITIAIFLQLAQVVLYSLLLVYNLSYNQYIITDMVTRWSLINGVVIMVAGVCQVVALRSIFKTKPPTTKTQLRAWYFLEDEFFFLICCFCVKASKPYPCEFLCLKNLYCWYI